MARVVAVLSVVLLLLSGCGRAAKKQASRPAAGQAQAQPQTPPFNPLSLQALRARTYPPSTVVVERKVAEESRFRTTIVSYESDSLVLFALMKTPAGPVPRGGFPVVVVLHGSQTPSGYSTIDAMRPVTDYFAAQGFLVLKPDYRGYGESSTREGGFARVGYYAVDVLSLLAAVPTVRDADPRNVFLLGQGMGGDVALRVAEASDRLRAASLWAPVAAPMPLGLVYYTRLRREASEARIRQIYGEAELPRLSTVDNLALLSAPLAVHHGTSDTLVPYEWSVDLAARAAAATRPLRLHEYQGEDHNLSAGGYRLALARDELFFREHLERSPR